MSNHSSFLAPISNLIALTVVGAPAGQFLQGQFTCDIQALAANQAVLGACCDHKGRMLVNGWIGRWNSELILFIPKNMADLTVAHLQRFAVFSKVSFSEKTGWKALSYFSTTPPLLTTHELIQYQSPDQSQAGYQLYNWFGPEKTIDLIQTELQKHAQLVDESLLMVMAQLVLVQPTTRELFIPQMIGLEKFGGVSFNKGCYVGQEVVARTQHLGQLKRHLFHLIFTGSTRPQAGDPIHNAAQEIVGNIAMVSLNTERGYQLLAVIQDRTINSALFFQQQPLIILSPSMG